MIILRVHDQSDVFCDLSVVCDPGVWNSSHMLVCLHSGCKKSVL
jgi:hypothetical protein